MENKVAIQEYKSPWGILLIGVYENQLVLCDWKYRTQRSRIDARIQSGLEATYTEDSTPLHQKVIQVLEQYAKGLTQEFDIPLLPVGTEFQQKVWQELGQIPFGKTLSYLDLSKKLGDEKAIRAVASANGANALSIFIPCHRVVASNGDLQGYAGGLPAKKKLLQLESAQTQLF